MLNSILGTELTLTSFLICTGVSLLLGVGTALVAGYRSRSAQSLAVTLAILPAVVQAPLTEGGEAGSAGYYLNGTKIGEVRILFAESVEKAGYLDYLQKVFGFFLL